MNNALREVFVNQIQDIYNSEYQILSALPKMQAAAINPNLRDALGDHLQETREQLARVEQICRILGIPTGNVTCQATSGLIREASEQMEKFGSSPAGDAAIIACAQKVEHYEISNYGTAIEWANLLDEHEVKGFLKDTLKEEQAADNRLNKVAKHEVNEAAANAAVVTSGSSANLI
jgi:ferritin-like metal-binding protein YciE